jgi:hypothetical protein
MVIPGTCTTMVLPSKVIYLRVLFVHVPIQVLHTYYYTHT